MRARPCRPLSRYFCLRTFGSREQPVNNAASTQTAATAYWNLDPFAIPISLDASHRANFVLSTPYYTKVLCWGQARKVTAVIIANLDNRQNQIAPMSKHTLVYRCFGNLPQTVAAWHSLVGYDSLPPIQCQPAFPPRTAVWIRHGRSDGRRRTAGAGKTTNHFHHRRIAAVAA